MILYLGLDPTRSPFKNCFHIPVIGIQPFPFEGKIQAVFEQYLPHASHVIVTSRQAAFLFAEHVKRAKQECQNKTFLAIGEATAQVLQKKGYLNIVLALQETGEGIVELIDRAPTTSHFFYPHSAQSRPLISQHLKNKNFPFTEIELYDTVPLRPQLPELERFEKIIFTSPSTVSAFFACTTQLPRPEQCHPIGPITAQALQKHFKNRSHA